MVVGCGSILVRVTVFFLVYTIIVFKIKVYKMRRRDEDRPILYQLL